MIDDKIKQGYPFPDEFTILESFGDAYQKRCIKGIYIDPRMKKRRIGQDGIVYLARILYKSRMLYLGLIDNISMTNIAVLYLTTRAYLETTAALGYFSYNLTKYYAGEIKYNDINSLLYALFAGSKDEYKRKSSTLIPESRNVLTMINTSDRLLKDFIKDGDKSEKLLSDLYTWISDICHPNSYGLLFGLVITTEKKVQFHDDPKMMRKNEFKFLLQIMIDCCNIFFGFYDFCISLLRDKEQMPKLIK